ncbi:Uncharacterised protein [Candidatus Tiddalikarchaeum anstoanum]|nr:Uncharacterised protein [Candidatus Tiddalikarchaeum anstoanum]
MFSANRRRALMVTIKIKIPKRIKIDFTFFNTLFDNKLVTFLCMIILFSLFEPVLATNYTFNNSENIQIFSNITCQENMSINSTCQNITEFNVTQQNQTFVESNSCNNITCQEGYHCVNSICLLNLSYVDVDPIVVYELSFNNWTPIIVRLADASRLSLTSNIGLNRQIYRSRAEYFDKFEDTILSTLFNNEFLLRHKFGIFNGFSVFVTRVGEN